jgi:hypothetical protein
MNIIDIFIRLKKDFALIYESLMLIFILIFIIDKFGYLFYL